MASTPLAPACSSRKQKKERTYDPNKARKMKRLELQRLQQESKELEATVSQLQVIRSQRSAAGRDNVDQTADFKELPAVWEDICGRQLQRRLKAERENEQLKEKLEEERVFVRSMLTIMQKRVLLQSMLHSGSRILTRRTEVPAGFVSHVVALVFEQLSAGIEDSLGEVDTVFGAGRFEVGGLANEPVVVDEMNGMYLELFDSKVVPFGTKATGDAWWRRWHIYKGQQLEGSGDSTIAEKYGLEMTDEKTNTCGKFYVQQILRRHQESNRIVIVWHAHIEPVEFDKKPVSGIQFLEKGYVLITPCDSHGETTRVSTCYVIMPHVSNIQQEEGESKALTKFVVNAMCANISITTEMVENLLVDQALLKHS